MKQNTIGVATLVSLSLLIIPFSFSVAKAETIAAPTTCYSFDKSFGRGASDARYTNAITQLQRFLAKEGHFDSSLIGTGVFGNKTREAVVRFQKAEGISPTGYVGPLTRHALLKRCQTPMSSSVTLWNITPASGSAGTVVTITGFGFSQSNTVYMDGAVAARNVPISSSIAVTCTTDPNCRGGIRQTITFTIPDSLSPNCPVGMMCAQYMRLVTPGTYGITVSNGSGISEGLTFTVTSTGTPNPLSISSLDAPTSLPMGVTGTWTINTMTNTSVGTLHYSVLWGDEPATQSATTKFRAPDTMPLPTTATFSHAYQTPGRYTPQFTVSDDNGHSVSTSASVVITPIY